MWQQLADLASALHGQACHHIAGSQPDKAFSEARPRTAVKMGWPRAYTSGAERATTIARAFGMDLIWVGLIKVIVVEVGLLTPPLRLSAFAVKANLDDQRIRVATVFKGLLPYVAAMLTVTVLLIMYPQMVTMLF